MDKIIFLFENWAQAASAHRPPVKFATAAVYVALLGKIAPLTAVDPVQTYDLGPSRLSAGTFFIAARKNRFSFLFHFSNDQPFRNTYVFKRIF